MPPANSIEPIRYTPCGIGSRQPGTLRGSSGNLKIEYPAKQQRVHPDKVRISFFVESPELSKEDGFNVFKTRADIDAFIEVKGLKQYQIIRMEIEQGADPNYIIVLNKTN